MYMILLTCPQSFSHNAHSGNRGWCPHTPCAISRVQNHPATEQATHWDEINNTKEITILLCLFPVHLFLSSISFTCPKFYWHTWDSTQNKLDFCWAMHCMSLKDTVSNPGLIAMCLVQQGQLWPLVYQWMLAASDPYSSLLSSAVRLSA